MGLILAKEEVATLDVALVEEAVVLDVAPVEVVTLDAVPPSSSRGR